MWCFICKFQIVPTITKQLKKLGHKPRSREANATSAWKEKTRKKKQEETLKMIQEFKDKMASKKGSDKAK